MTSPSDCVIGGDDCGNLSRIQRLQLSRSDRQELITATQLQAMNTDPVATVIAAYHVA